MPPVLEVLQSIGPVQKAATQEYCDLNSQNGIGPNV